jgi:hypothetical protein
MKAGALGAYSALQEAVASFKRVPPEVPKVVFLYLNVIWTNSERATTGIHCYFQLDGREPTFSGPLWSRKSEAQSSILRSSGKQSLRKSGISFLSGVSSKLPGKEPWA